MKVKVHFNEDGDILQKVVEELLFEYYVKLNKSNN